jgi:hypothetical protein
MDRISSPEQLSDYLRVTNPGIWCVLSAVILLLAGIIVWASVGVLETSVDAKAVVLSEKAEIIITGAESSEIKSGMKLRIASNEYIISETGTDEYGRSVASAAVSLPDGSYEAEIVVEEIHPISFLFESR